MAIVRIRKWLDMEKEFGLDKEGDIQTPVHPFVSLMEEQLPGSRVIEAVWDEDSNSYLWFPFKDTLDYWEISKEMIEEYIDKSEEEIL